MLALLVGGCEERPAVTIEGERVDVAPYFAAPVCAGSVARFDAFVAQIEDASGLSGPDHITFYWGPDAALQNCPAPAVGCATENTPQVFGYLNSLQHELAHAIGRGVGTAVPVVEEGFAIAHGGICASLNGGLDRIHSIREFLDVPRSRIHRSGGAGIAGHFALYLAQIYGPQRWSDFKAASPPGLGPADLATAFASAYPVSLDDAERQWFTEAPRLMCPQPVDPLTIWSGAPLRLAGDLDCDDVGTQGPFDRSVVNFPSFDDSDIVEVMFVEHRVVVPFVDMWHVEFDGPPEARAWLFARDCVDVASADASDAFEREISAGVRADLLMNACTYMVVLAAPPDEPTRVELRISPMAESK